MARPAIKKCPFCGRPGKVVSLAEVDDIDVFDMPDSFINSWTVNCNVNKGGCGACGGYKVDKKEAVAIWNQRA